MRKINLVLLVAFIMLSNNLSGQTNVQVGYAGASLNTTQSLGGGLALYLGRNISESRISSLSLSTNIKLGIEDKTGSGLIIPAIFLFVYTGVGNNTSAGSGNGGTVHLFTELPLLVHYNFGLGSTDQNDKRAGFYFGGGFNYVMTGFTDTAGYSKKTSFFGGVIDGGIRFNKIMDVNFETVFPFAKTIGEIKHPMFYQITFLLTIKPVIY
jgi:hypothetical protein